MKKNETATEVAVPVKSLRQRAQEAQKPEKRVSPVEFHIRVQNDGTIHIFDVKKEENRTIESVVNPDSPNPKIPLLDLEPINRLSFLPIDDGQYFLNGQLMHEGEKEWFSSTPYRKRSDVVSVFLRKSKGAGNGFDFIKVASDTVANMKPRKEEIEASKNGSFPLPIFEHELVKLTSCQYIWAYSPTLGGVCRIELTASGRDAYGNFKAQKEQRKSGVFDFTITGFAPVFGKDDSKKKQADAPVFAPYVASNIDNDKADEYVFVVADYTGMNIDELRKEIPVPPTPEMFETMVGNFEVADANNNGDIPDDLPM